MHSVSLMYNYPCFFSCLFIYIVSKFIGVDLSYYHLLYDE